MNILTELLYSLPPAPLPKKARLIVAKEMRISSIAKNFRRGEAYGTIQPRILEYLKANKDCSPSDVARDLKLNGDSVRRGLRALYRKNLAHKTREPAQGEQRISALWRAL